MLSLTLSFDCSILLCKTCSCSSLVLDLNKLVSKLCCNFSIPIFHSQMHIHQNKSMGETFILHMNGNKPQSVLLCKWTLAKYWISEISKKSKNLHIGTKHNEACIYIYDTPLILIPYVLCVYDFSSLLNIFILW